MATITSPYRTPILRPQLERRLTSKKKTFPYVAVSTVNSLCPRAFYYSSRLPARDYVMEFRSIMNFALGHIAEMFVERLFENANIHVVDREIKIEFEPGDLPGVTAKSGRIDFMIKLANDYYLIEVKKMNPRRLNLFKVRGLQTEQSAHFQLLSYLHLWNKAIANGENLPPVKGLIVGVGVEPPEIIDTSVEYSKEDFDSFMPHLQVLDAYKTAFETHKKTAKSVFDIDPPDRPEHLNIESFQCRACPFYKDCYTNSGIVLDPDELTSDEVKLLNEAMVDIRKAYYDSKNAEDLKAVAIDTLKGLMFSRDAHSLQFKSTIGELALEVGIIDKETVDTDKMTKTVPHLIEKYTKKSTEHRMNVDIKLSPQLEALASGRIKAISKDGRFS